MAVSTTTVATPPPVKGGGNAKPKVIQGKTVEQAYTEAAEGAMRLFATGALLLGWHADAAAISMHAPKIAPEVAKIAENNEKVAAGLSWLTESGPYAELIEVTLVLGLQLAVNHGMFKPEKLANAGIQHPDALAAEFRASMAEQAVAALKKQKDAEDRLRTAQLEAHATLNGQDNPGDSQSPEGTE